MKRGGRHEVPPLLDEIMANDCSSKSKSQVFSKGMVHARWDHASTEDHKAKRTQIMQIRLYSFLILFF